MGSVIIDLRITEPLPDTVEVVPDALFCLQRSNESSGQFRLVLGDIGTVLNSKTYNDELLIDGGVEIVSTLKLLRLLLSGIDNYTTVYHNYAFTTTADTQMICNYLDSFEFLAIDEDEDESAIDEDDTDEAEASEPVYIQLSDEEMSLSPFARLSDDERAQSDDLQAQQYRKKRFRHFRRQSFELSPRPSLLGYLLLDIESATGLPPLKDSIRLRYDMDAFVVVSFGTNVYRTKTRRHNLNPEWINQFVNLEVTKPEEHFDLRFNIFDRDRFTSNDRVCSVRVPVSRFIKQSGWHNIKLDMEVDSSVDNSVLSHKPVLSVRYKFQTSDDLIEALYQHDVDPRLPQRFRQCPLCGQLDRRNHSLLKHVAVCQAGLRPKTFLKKAYSSSQNASRRWYTKALMKVAYGRPRLGGNNANIMVQDRNTGMIIEEQMSIQIRLGIRLLYRSIRSPRSSKRIKRYLYNQSMKQGARFDSPESVVKIEQFINFYGLDLSNCVKRSPDQYATFNEFFSRKLKPSARTVEGKGDWIATSMADSRLSVFSTVAMSQQVWIKGRDFSVSKLVGEARGFESGSLAIFRLAPQDYHRFHSPVSGIVRKIKHIEGEYYTVNPMAIRSKLDVFGENVRTIIELETEYFGQVILCAIGAMMVGSIVVDIKEGDRVLRGDDLGHFKFGGSTVVALFQEGRVKFDRDLLYNSEQRSIETLVSVGMSIGHTPTTEQFKRRPLSRDSIDRVQIVRTITGVADDTILDDLDGLDESDD